MLKAACTGSRSIAGAGDARAVVHGEAGDERAEELGAGGEVEGLEAAAEGVEEAVAGGLVG